MQVVKEWSDDTIGAVLFDDGHKLAFDEKAAVLLTPDATVLNTWWKEEPSGPHWEAFLSRPQTVLLPVSDELYDAIFDAGHRCTEDPLYAAGVKLLSELLV